MTVAGQSASAAAPAVAGAGVGVLVDIPNCIGCRLCERACAAQAGFEVPPVEAYEDKSIFAEHRRPAPDALTVVNEYRSPTASAQPLYVKANCLHCQEPACPFQIPAYEYDNTLTPQVRKCTLCFEKRAAEGGVPATRVGAQPSASVLRQGDVQCEVCHTRPDPTAEDAALRACARPKTAEFARQMSHKHGPSVVILDDLEDLYLPVPFDHQGHAQMATMTQGCAVCHHYTPQGLEHPACRTCHEPKPVTENIRKPGLKGAYHRQCLNCHREWTGETQCNSCHHPKTGSPGKGGPEVTPTKGDLIGQMHPPIPEPDVEIYLTRGKGPASSKVIFRHKEHLERFGLRCAECHHEDSCMRCHENGKEHSQQIRTVEQHHQPCAQCHNVKNEDTCNRCHWQDGEPKPPPFDHASTGWPLGRHHEEKSCRQCHDAVPFTAPQRHCEACHSDWEVGSFDHAVTGQGLDENHREQDCADCHVEREFEKAPTCDACHDEDEGISFPERRPGPAVDRDIPALRQE